MSSTTSIEAGAEVAGFRLERLIGHGSKGTVFEATQLGLDRRVALKLLPPDPALAERLLPWPEHPGVVDLYGLGSWEHGQYVATQLVRGSTLAELPRDRILDALEKAAAALDAAHREGIAHGAVNARNVLIDARGGVFLSDFGLGDSHPSPAADRTAFQAMVRECLGVTTPEPAGEPQSAAAIVETAARALPRAPSRGTRRSPRWRIAAIAATAALAALAALLLATGGDEEPEAAPPLPEGTRALGSSIGAGAVSSVDCLGREPSGASDACTLVQTRLPGRRLAAPSDGVIRSWTVRGARGELALQVLRRHGDRFVWVARTPYVVVPDEGVHVLPATVELRAGDLVGVNVAPGAAVGVHRGARGAATERWLGLARSSSTVTQGDGTGFGHELLLRVAYEPGARLDAGLTGHAAEVAPRGRRLSARVVEPRGGGTRTVAVVHVGDGIALDLFDGSLRLVRLAVADADPRGHPVGLITYGRPLVSLSWRNPDGRTIGHDYAIRPNAVVPRS